MNKDRSLAIAYELRQRLAKRKQEHDQPMPTPAQPTQTVKPVEENMGRTAHAVRMARGGMCDCPRCAQGEMPEPQMMHKGGQVDSAESDADSLDQDSRLAMNDTYPEGAAESDTQAQDEGFGEGSMDNTTGDSDQETNRKKTRASRALDAARAQG